MADCLGIQQQNINKNDVKDVKCGALNFDRKFKYVEGISSDGAPKWPISAKIDVLDSGNVSTCTVKVEVTEDGLNPRSGSAEGEVKRTSTGEVTITISGSSIYLQCSILDDDN